MRASCANSSAISASFDSWLSAVRSTDSSESTRRSRVNHHLHSVRPRGTWAVTPDLPYGLDVSHGEKVLSILWADDGSIEVATFVRGAWEDEALEL